MATRSGIAGVALGGLIAAALALVTPSGGKAQPDTARQSAAENFRIEHEIGRRFRIDPADLPPPRAGPTVRSPATVVPYSGQGLAVPQGFVATPFATGLDNPRRLLVLPNGDVLVANQRGGSLLVLRDDGTGRAVSVEPHVSGLNQPYGLALRGDHVLVADQDAIWRVPTTLGAAAPGGRAGAQMVTERGVFGAARGHRNRPLAVDPRSGALFVGVGSIGNVGIEPAIKATIQRFDPDGSNQTTYASGARNPTALAFHPATGELWAGVQERDGLGDDLPSDYMIAVRQGGFYGWPYAYLGPNPQPGFAERAPDKVRATIVPDLLLRAHSSLLDFVFYDAEQFPPEYRGSAFVALRGSWNRSQPTGYKVVLVPFSDGRPAGYYENFATGFWQSGEQRAEVWGRPAAVAVARDGALLVADDTGGTIWRIAYAGPR